MAGRSGADRIQRLGAQPASVTPCQCRLSVTRGRYFGSLSGSFVDNAFWQDWDPRFVGATPSYSTLDGGFGVHSADDAMTVAVRAKNLLNTAVKEHVFGDLITRTVTGEVIFRF